MFCDIVMETEKTFFTSDNHFNHENIIKFCFRGYGSYEERKNNPELHFKSIGEMNEIMVQRWNEVVGPTDTVYVLGDFAMGDKYKSVEYFNRLNGTKHLVLGNHDCNNFVKKVVHPAILEMGFASITEELYAKIDGRNVWMAHIPYGYNNDNRNYLREKVKPGFSLKKDVILSGHVHDGWIINNYNSINVGTDVWDFYPQTLSQLLEKTKDLPRFDSTIFLPV